MTLKKPEYIERYGEEAYKAEIAKTKERARKEAYIARHGVKAWRRRAAKKQAWNEAHSEEANNRSKKWALENPEKVKARNREIGRKGGKHYEKMLKDSRTGLRGERNRIRFKHAYQYRSFKKIIAPESQIHHEWIPKTAEYRGVALVEANPHRYGIIDVIQILDGKITLFTEEKIEKRGKKNNEKEN